METAHTADHRRWFDVERRRWRPNVHLATAVLIGAVLAASEVAVGQADAVVGVSTGVFTDEQVAAGAEAFERHCAMCHGAALEGAVGPTLAPLDRFQFSDAPLSRLFDLMRTEMPFSDPGSLDADTYLSILTFVLSENGYPSGDEPLSGADEAIARYVLDTPPAE
jgi:mono/diheme cytochrome c family protein